MGANEQGADATEGRWVTIPRTLSFIFHNDDVLLMKRASHRRVFPNQYNGVGGHIERDEDPSTGAIREIKEETGLDIQNVLLRGVHHIDAGASQSGILLFVFTANSDSRDVSGDDSEGTLHWINQNDIMSLDLVEDLPLILARILRMTSDDKPYFAHVSYDQNDQIQITFSEDCKA